MPTLGTLASGLGSVAPTRRSEAYITELDDDDRPVEGEGGFQIRKFQYYPESLNDTKAVNYQTKEVPGGSIPLYQYINSGEHSITFTAVFTTDVDHLAVAGVDELRMMSSVVGALGDQRFSAAMEQRTSVLSRVIAQARDRFRASGVLNRNPYIPGALVWLRRFMFPRYGESTEVGVPLTRPPHKLLLHFPNSEMERLGGMGAFSAPGGGILCIMVQCDITIVAKFPTGNIREATVDLGFAEVAQRGGVVRFPSASGLDALTDWYSLSSSARSLIGG